MTLRLVLQRFHGLLAALFACNVVIWVCMLWTVLWRVNHEQPCTTNAWTSYVHFFVEIMFFEALWLLLIWKLGRNQYLLERYRDDLSAKVVMRSAEQCAEKLVILDYLDTIKSSRSPFKIYGVVPTANRIFWVFTAILGPLTWNISKYLWPNHSMW